MAGTFLVEKYLQDVAVEEAKPELQLPRQYKVFLLNDDYTTMEFVVEVLQSFFQKDEATATRIMLQIHTQGKGICGLFSRDIAETKVAQVNEFANRHQQPLLCSMEPE